MTRSAEDVVRDLIQWLLSRPSDTIEVEAVLSKIESLANE